MEINNFGMYSITPILCIIANVFIILKTVDYCFFKCLKEE